MGKKGAKSARNKWEDYWARQAKKEGYPARSVYKLKEIQKKFSVLSPGDKVLDLGCSPGSWLLFAARTVGGKGSVTGVDLKPVTISSGPNVRVFTGDVASPEVGLLEELGAGFNVVLSDMAPSTSGNKSLDALRSEALSEAALSLAERVLAPGGTFVCKIFQGPGFEGFVSRARKAFGRVKLYKPPATRKASREIYLVAKDKKPPPG
ncbi:MAG: RlmE family RNA methyltransferase [Deltaproteobacteria bacterium]|nr:RlmE family RNA methyltransferase [Deltaproteobacteria bacterium]